jgi:hypothetical protein
MEPAAPNTMMEYQRRAGPGICPIMTCYMTRVLSILKLDFYYLHQVKET